MLCAILLAGGEGLRMGLDRPKQYLQLRGQPVIGYSLSTLNGHHLIDSIIIVAAETWRPRLSCFLSEAGIAKFQGFADPGETRQFSVWNALHMLGSFSCKPDSVLIHDAARPLLTSSLITRCVSSLSGHDGVMPVLPVKDTVYLTDRNGKITQLLNRSALAAGQAPEVFNFEKYYNAHLRVTAEELRKFNGSTEIAVAQGMDVVTVEGEERNIKITTVNDLRLAEKYLEETGQ